MKLVTFIIIKDKNVYFLSENKEVKKGDYFIFNDGDCILCDEIEISGSYNTVISNQRRYYGDQCYKVVCTNDENFPTIPKPTEQFLTDLFKFKDYYYNDRFRVNFGRRGVISIEPICECSCCKRRLREKKNKKCQIY